MGEVEKGRSGSIVQIEYEFFSEGQRRQIEAVFDGLSSLLPHWLERLSVQSYTSNADFPLALAKVNVQEPYRLATIEVYSSFFTEEDDRQTLAIVHEIIHIHHGAMMDFIRGSMLDYVQEKSPELYRHFDIQYTKENERVTQDLAIMIARLLERAKENRLDISPGQIIPIRPEDLIG